VTAPTREAEALARRQAVGVGRAVAYALADVVRELRERRVRGVSWTPTQARALDSGQCATAGGILRVADGELLLEPKASSWEGRAIIRVHGRPVSRVGPHTGPPVLLLEDRPDDRVRREVRDGSLPLLPGDRAWALRAPGPGVTVLDGDAAAEVAEEIVRRVLLVRLVRRGEDR